MGQRNSKKKYIPPDELHDFRKSAKVLDEVIIPEPAVYRSPTDPKYFVVFVGCFFILLACSIYTVAYADSQRMYNGYDNCGNICGKDNPKIESINCSGANYIDRPYLKVNRTTGQRQCMAKCNQTEDLEDLSDLRCRIAEEISFYELYRGAENYIICMVFVAFGVCLLMFLILRYVVAGVVWFTIVGTLVSMITISGFALNDAIQNGSDGCTKLFLLLMFLGLILFTVFMIATSHKKIKLIIQLFEESVKAISAMPVLIVKPLLIFTLLILVIRLFIYLQFLFSSAGTLKQISETKYDYVPNAMIVSTQIFNVCVTVWYVFFILGCQDMVIAGAISAWYFARNKGYLPQPVKSSMLNLGRFHLGSVAYASLIMLIMKAIRNIITGVMAFGFLERLCGICLEGVEDFFGYFSKNACIQIAMHGQQFFESGKRGFRLIMHSFVDAVTLQFVGGFVIFMVKLFIVCVVVIIAVAVQQDKSSDSVALLVIAICSALMAHCFFNLFETASDTIFMCYCEDKFMNNGIERPYFMSPELRKFNDDIVLILTPRDPESIRKMRFGDHKDDTLMSFNMSETSIFLVMVIMMHITNTFLSVPISQTK